uniref:hypothetical protein n=1 Tax=Staphylococcus haemolyticus TaxID=1283 RepID=UPI0015D92FF4
QYSIIKYDDIPVLEVSLHKQQLTYFISFLSIYQFSIYQNLSPKRVNTLLDTEQPYQSSKRFDLAIDGLHDAFIKDKVIDIMTYFSNIFDIKYTLNNNCASICWAPETFSNLLQTIACRNIDILSASYKTRVLHKTNIS